MCVCVFVEILDDDYSKGKFASVSSSAVDGLTGSVTSGIDASGTPSASFGYKMLLRGYEIACRFCSDGSVRAEALCSGLTERLKLLVSAEQSAKKGTSGESIERKRTSTDFSSLHHRIDASTTCFDEKEAAVDDHTDSGSDRLLTSDFCAVAAVANYA